MRDCGANVIDIGMVDTPVVYFAINHFGCAGGIQVTASHNPANYNGFKISRAHAKPVGQETGLIDIQRFAALVEKEKCEPLGGRIESRDVWTQYKDHLLRLLNDKTKSGAKKLRVVIDASNGMAGTMVPKVFGQVAGLKIDPIHFDNSSGEFVHEPNPLVEANLAEVRARVRETKADFGVCFDGDADRCMVIDELGEPIGCDLLLAVMLKEFLGRHPGAHVVYDLRSSRSVAEAIREAGGTPVESRVGHVFMKAKLAEVQAPVGGELSGHFYFQDMFATDSGARAFIAVINALVDGGGKTLSQLVKPFRRYAQSGEINFENENKLGAIAALRAAYPDAKTHELDGLSLDAGKWWCNVRMSNTEPLLRLNLEAKDQATVDAIVATLSPLLGHRVAH